MPMMKNATGNVIRIVPFDKIPQWESKGFIVCEDVGGGSLPPLAPIQDEPPEVIAPVILVEEFDDPYKYGDKYWNQLNKTELHALMEREGVEYNESDTVAQLRTIYGRYLNALKRKKK